MTQELATALGLSPRQAEVLAMLATGLRRKQIADRLGIADTVLDAHIRAARERLSAGSTTHAVVLYDRAIRGNS